MHKNVSPKYRRLQQHHATDADLVGLIAEQNTTHILCHDYEEGD